MSKQELKENETVELKKSLAELKQGLISIVAILDKHKAGTFWFGEKFGKKFGKNYPLAYAEQPDDDLGTIPKYRHFNTRHRKSPETVAR